MPEAQRQPASPPVSVDPIAWFTNPLDWRAIDRIILLGLLVMLAPGLFALVLMATMVAAPDYLHPAVAWPLLGLYGVHLGALAGFLAAAFGRRQRAEDWPLFEAFVIASFVFTVLLTGYLTGTHFAECLLLIFLGINVTSALGTISRLRLAYYFGLVIFAVIAVLDFTRMLPTAPLLAKPLMSPDGSMVLGWMLVRVLLGAAVLAIGSISIAAISRWVERENLFREMSTVDGLTRLSNRRSFIERGESELSRARRFADNPVACIMVDLDHFKKINDTYGHHVGDQVLVAASAILMNRRRQYDEVGRYGGEEFALLLPGTNAETAMLVAERIRAEFAGTPVEVDGHRVLMTASFGVAAYPAADITCLNDLLKAADKALYVAKEGGRNRVCMAEEKTGAA